MLNIQMAAGMGSCIPQVKLVFSPSLFLTSLNICNSYRPISPLKVGEVPTYPASLQVPQVLSPHLLFPRHHSLSVLKNLPPTLWVFNELLMVVAIFIPMIQDDRDDAMLLLLVFSTNVAMETFPEDFPCGIRHCLRMGPMTGDGSMDECLWRGSTLGLASLEMMWISQILQNCQEELSRPSTQPDVPVMLNPGVSVGVDSSSRPTPLRSAIVSFEGPSLERVMEFVCLVEYVPVETGEDFDYDSNLLD